ncbi:hypothetical protein Clacol_004609 [Clathrus columnatus]|uniref:Uncharacterized protein n=1 Tax=Clathrus columnatus TaxID=1419009 RepID=A0AAV5AA84_9AGAM|nr:hypothetical protein Clacol_004609 [Clathrus columnatus]
MEVYGREAWMSYWAKLMDKPWGPDPLLTDVGTEQAYNINSIWKQELSSGIPIPESFYVSPLSRAIQTVLISFEGIAFPSGNNPVVAPKAIIKEKLREANYLQHTCNMRRIRSFIKETYPQFEIEEGFTEEDVFWNNSETDGLMKTRVREGLDEIFEKDTSWYISITAHAVTNSAIQEVLGVTAKRNMPTGGVFAMVISMTPTSV